MASKTKTAKLKTRGVSPYDLAGMHRKIKGLNFGSNYKVRFVPSSSTLIAVTVNDENHKGSKITKK
jgi:hypothetical protein